MVCEKERRVKGRTRSDTSTNLMSMGAPHVTHGVHHTSRTWVNGPCQPTWLHLWHKSTHPMITEFGILERVTKASLGMRLGHWLFNTIKDFRVNFKESNLGGNLYCSRGCMWKQLGFFFEGW